MEKQVKVVVSKKEPQNKHVLWLEQDPLHEVSPKLYNNGEWQNLKTVNVPEELLDKVGKLNDSVKEFDREVENFSSDITSFRNSLITETQQRIAADSSLGNRITTLSNTVSTNKLTTDFLIDELNDRVTNIATPKVALIEVGNKTIQQNSVIRNYDVVFLSTMKCFAAKTSDGYFNNWGEYSVYPSADIYGIQDFNVNNGAPTPIVSRIYSIDNELYTWDGNDFIVQGKVDEKLNEVKEELSDVRITATSTRDRFNKVNVVLGDCNHIELSEDTTIDLNDMSHVSGTYRIRGDIQYISNFPPIRGTSVDATLVVKVMDTTTGYKNLTQFIILTSNANSDDKLWYRVNNKSTSQFGSWVSIDEFDNRINWLSEFVHKDVYEPFIEFNKSITELQKSDAQLTNSIEAKQDELTLTVLDNGNIRIGNLQGQTKDFMPATPSGDPMHYAYINAGAEYNATSADIIKAAPWANLVDTDEDKVVVHKAGYWYLNGLGDLTNMDMANIHRQGVLQKSDSVEGNTRTNYGFVYEVGYLTLNDYTIYWSRNLEVVNYKTPITHSASIRLVSPHALTPVTSKLKHIIGELTYFITTDTIMNIKHPALRTIKLKSLTKSINMSMCKVITKASVLYMINNCKPTKAITVQLHADAYARIATDAGVISALETKNASLASSGGSISLVSA